MAWQLPIPRCTLVLLVMAAILLPMALPVVAHATYCGTEYRYVRGAHRQKDAYVKGAQGHIYVFDRHLCDASDQGDGGGWQGAWVMVRRSTGAYYLQSGYVRVCDNLTADEFCIRVHAWAEYSVGDCNGCPYQRVFSDSLNRYQTYNFKVERRPSDDMWLMTYNVIGGSAILINIVSSDTLRFSKDVAVYAGETHNGYTYMPGSSSTRVLFSSLRWKSGSTPDNAVWYTPSLTCANGGVDANYHSDCTNGDSSFHIWDSR